MIEFRKRFLDMQKELPKIERDTENKFFKSSYATLPQVLSKVTPVLHKHGFYTSGYHDGIAAFVVKIIDSTSEDFVSSEIPLVGVTDMQKLGSAFTYAYRYGLLALLGIAPDMDDDGNSVSGKEPEKTVAPKKKEPPKTIEATFEQIVGLYNEHKADLPAVWIPRIEELIANKSMPDLQKTYIAIKKEVDSDTKKDG